MVENYRQMQTRYFRREAGIPEMGPLPRYI